MRVYLPNEQLDNFLVFQDVSAVNSSQAILKLTEFAFANLRPERVDSDCFQKDINRLGVSIRELFGD